MIGTSTGETSSKGMSHALTYHARRRRGGCLRGRHGRHRVGQSSVGTGELPVLRDQRTCHGRVEPRRTGTPVVLWTNNNGSNQIWNTEAASEGGTYLHPAYNWGLCLDFDGASAGNSIPVKVNNCDGSASQRWFFGNHPSGGNRIATHSDFRYCVDVPNYNFAQGQQIALWDCNDTTAQLWLA